MVVAFAAGALAAGGVGALVHERNFSTNPHVKNGTRSCDCDEKAEDATAAEQRERLLRENDEIRSALLTALVRAPTCDGVTTPTPQVPKAPELPSAEDAASQEAAEVVSLHMELDQEPLDLGWAPGAERAAAVAIAATGSMRVQEVKCRESLCRVTVSHNELAKRDEDVEKLLTAAPGAGQARVYARENEDTTVMYFARQGRPLSVFDGAVPEAPGAD
jgi:hypothetical protein